MPLSDAETDLFDMANLFPRSTGLSMTIWVCPRGGAHHDVRVKVNRTHGNRMDPADTAVVGLRPSPHLVAGDLDTPDRDAVFAWTALNLAALVAYWDGEIDTIQLGERLRRL